MPKISAENMLPQLIIIGEIAVVGHANPIGRVDIKGLGQCRTGAARSGIAHMAYTQVAYQSQHMIALEHILYQSLAFALMLLTLMIGNNTSGILPAVLQHGQCIIEPQIDFRCPRNTYYTAHDLYPTGQ